MKNTFLHCATCDTDNPSDATSCSHCGQPLIPAGASSSHSELPASARLLNDRYRIIAQAGAGGFSTVYKAADTRFGDRPVALKEMGQQNLDAQELVEAVERFQQEALLLAHLQHPHLPRIYDHFSEEGRWYLVMDYIEGETLEDVLEHLPRDPRSGTSHMQAEEVLAIGIQLFNVLEYLHARQPPIIFRDLKPANVMRTPDEHLYLIDFGIARHFKSGQTRDTIPLGSPGYAAPEQYGKKQTTTRSDIYSLGVMLHQLLTGNDPTDAPFRLAPLQFSGNPALSRLETLITRMIDLDEDARPATITLVKKELQQIAALPLSTPIQTLPPEVRESEPDTRTTPSSSQMTQQVQIQETPREEQQQEQRGKDGPSRRAIIIGLAGLAIAGGSVWSWLATHQSPPVEPTPATPFTYRGHSDVITTAAWSLDGRQIASASADGTVQLWSTATGRTIFTYTDPTHVYGGIYAAVWSPDGTKIASATSQLVQEWQVH